MVEMTEYEAVKKVLERRIEYLKWKVSELRDERKDIASDPEMGRDCLEYREVMTELRGYRIRKYEVEDLLESLDADVCELLTEN